MRVVNFCGIVRHVIDEENLRKFRCEGVRRFYGDRSEAVSWSTHDGRGENLQFSHWGPQRKPTKCLWWGERRQKSLKWTWSARKVQSMRSSCRTRVQRYDEHLGVSKFFGQKMQSIFILPSPPYKTILFNPIFAHFNTKYYIITLLQKNVRWW